MDTLDKKELKVFNFRFKYSKLFFVSIFRIQNLIVYFVSKDTFINTFSWKILWFKNTK